MRILIIGLLFIYCIPAYPQACDAGNTGAVPTGGNYELIWADEFDDDGLVCEENWHFQTQCLPGQLFCWANDELQHYTNRSDNAFVENGTLKIVAKREDYLDQGLDLDYTSARLNSKFAFTYGRVDVRAKLPPELGTWPAIWMLGKNISEAGAFFAEEFGTTPWPATGEIDIMEQFGRNAPEKNDVHGTTHTPAGFAGSANGGKTSAPTSTTEFHVYSMIWDEDEIQFLYDDQVYYTYNPITIYGVKNESTWPFDEPQFILLNIAMGGVLGGNVPNDFVDATMEIDYVRVFQNYDEDPSDNAALLDEQTITFNEISDKTLGDAPFELNATASSGLEVSFSSSSNKISLSGRQVTLLEAGSVTIDADQGGNATYEAAPTVSRTFCINPMKPSISTSDNNITGTTLSSSNSLGNQWFLDGIAIDGATNMTLETTSPGLYAVQSSVDACFSEISEPFEVIDPADLIPQTITFPAVADIIIDAGTFELEATASSGLEVTFTTFSTELDINGSTVSLLQPGTVVVTAEQAGNNEFLPAEPVTQVFCVNPSKPSITQVERNDDIVLISSSENGNRWYFNGERLFNNNEPELVVEDGGVYTLKVQVDGCESPFSEELPVIITSVTDLTVSEIVVYPNPAKDNIEVASGRDIQSIQIFNALGSSLPLTFERVANKWRANLRDLQPGIYYLKIHTDNENYTARIVKQ